MESLRVETLLDAIDAAFAAGWQNDGALFQAYRDGNQLWFRQPDAVHIFRVTVEELPRDQWPEL